MAATPQGASLVPRAERISAPRGRKGKAAKTLKGLVLLKVIEQKAMHAAHNALDL